MKTLNSDDSSATISNPTNVYGRRARSKSFETSEKKENIAKATDEYAGSSLKLSSYGESACEGEINDSRFNDISCIDYADRTIDEKDNASRIDVEENNPTNNCSESFNASNASSCGSKRKHN